MLSCEVPVASQISFIAGENIYKRECGISFVLGRRGRCPRKGVLRKRNVIYHRSDLGISGLCRESGQPVFENPLQPAGGSSPCRTEGEQPPSLFSHFLTLFPSSLSLLFPFISSLLLFSFCKIGNGQVVGRAQG